MDFQPIKGLLTSSPQSIVIVAHVFSCLLSCPVQRLTESVLNFVLSSIFFFSEKCGNELVSKPCGPLACSSLVPIKITSLDFALHFNFLVPHSLPLESSIVPVRLLVQQVCLRVLHTWILFIPKTWVRHESSINALPAVFEVVNMWTRRLFSAARVVAAATQACWRQCH